MHEVTDTQAVLPAAAVLLHRGDKIWLGQRGKVRFLPGFSVFPGGGCHEGETFQQAAIRELSEETGLRCHESMLQPFSRAITPPYSQYRFDVRVYSLELGTGREPEPDGFELIAGHWMTPDEVLWKRRQGDIQLAPPTYRQIKQWKNRDATSIPSEETAFAQPPARNEKVLPMANGICVIPLPTSALPPAAWTNTVLLGERDYYLVDPGGPEQDHLREEMARRSALGQNLRGVLLTHHHPDHIEGYHQLKADKLTLFCHPKTAELLPSEFPKPRLLEHGNSLNIAGDLTIEAIYCPGHAPGHLAFYIPQRRTLLAGDMISSLSSIVIPADNGCLVDYLESLERLRQINAGLVIPSHGPPFGGDSDPFGTALIHRQKRESQVLATLSAEPTSVETITQKVYGKLDPRLVGAAQVNVNHYLKKLEREAKVFHRENGWLLNEDAAN